MTWAEVLTVIMLSCGQDSFCQQEQIACVVRHSPTQTDQAANRRAVTHCLRVKK